MLQNNRQLQTDGHAFRGASPQRETEQGFTLIEVMVASTIFLVALIGLVSLQKASIYGQRKSNHQTTAVDISRIVMGWLQSEAESWRWSPTADVGPSDDNQPLISKAVSAGLGSWVNLGTPSGTFRFDHFMGHSNMVTHAEPNPDSAMFCVFYRLEPVATTGNTNFESLYKTTVRVMWPREGFFPADWKTCANMAAEPDIQSYSAQSIITRMLSD